MASKEEKDLVVKEGAALIDNANAMEGLEDIDESSIALPRVKLLQATSPEVQGDEYRDLNLRAGDLIENISKEKIDGTIIPVKVLPSTNVLFVPRTAEMKAQLKAIKTDITDTELEAPGNMLCISLDGKTGDRYGSCSACRLCLFRGNDKPICQRAINILVMLSNGMPAIVSFRDTSYKHGSKFVSLLRNKALAGVMIQKCKYKLVPTKKTSGDKQWYELAVIMNGNCTDEEANRAYQMYLEYKKINLNTVEEQEDTQANSDDDLSEII